VIKLKGIGHVNLRVADEQASKRFYRDVLGFAIAEEDPDHGGVFMTLGENFHTLDLGQHPSPAEAQRPRRDQIGLAISPFRSAAIGRSARPTRIWSTAASRSCARPTTSTSAAFILPTRTATRSKSITRCRTRWNCSPTAAPTMTRHCRSAARTTRCRRGCSKTGPDRRSKRRSSASASGTRRRPPPDRLSFP
jgi:hypothetical protein